MGNPNLTKILFAGLIVTFVFVTLTLNYSNFASWNNSTIEAKYQAAFNAIASEQSNFTSIGTTVQDKGLVTSILNFGESAITGTVNVFVTGLKAMGTFFNMIPIWGNILSAISLGLPWLSALINLLILMVGVYIAMRYIQSVSNKQDLP